MSGFKQYINDLIEATNYTENAHLKTLSNHGGVSTHWAAFHNDTNPGFFTPFNQKLSENNTAGMKQAALTAIFLPILKLRTAIGMALYPAISPLVIIASVYNAEWDNAFKQSIAILVTPGLAIYFSGAFVLNLLKEVTALITRTIATLVELCKRPVNNVVNEEPNDETDVIEMDADGSFDADKLDYPAPVRAFN